MITKPGVLFLCSHNAARSQMAEAILRRHAGERFEVHSAGLQPTAIHPLTIKVMREAGYDLSGHAAKGVREFLGHKLFRYVISVCEHTAPHCPRLFPGTAQVLSWPFADPAAAQGPDEAKLNAFRDARDAIELRVRAWLDEPDGTAPVQSLAGRGDPGADRATPRTVGGGR